MNDDLLKRMHEMLGVQGSDGNWDYDPYMHGMYNGMEYMMAMVDGREPVFRDAPEQWGCYRAKNSKDKTMKVLDEFDVVINTLQKQHDVLWRMTEQNMNSEFGMSLLDDIRFKQMDQLQQAIDMWKGR